VGGGGGGRGLGDEQEGPREAVVDSLCASEHHPKPSPALNPKP
jgi:hypothetical protein